MFIKNKQGTKKRGTTPAPGPRRSKPTANQLTIQTAEEKKPQRPMTPVMRGAKVNAKKKDSVSQKSIDVSSCATSQNVNRIRGFRRATKLRNPKEAAKSQAQATNARFRELREKAITRDNWNFFVGDTAFKTDTILQFLSPLTNSAYEKFATASSRYSQGIAYTISLFIGISNPAVRGSYFYIFLTLVFYLGALFTALPQNQKNLKQSHPLLKVLLINLFPIFTMLAAFDNYYYARQRQLDLAALINFKSADPMPTASLALPALSGGQAVNDRISDLVNKSASDEKLDQAQFHTVLNLFGESSAQPEAYTYALLDREVSLAVYAFSLPLLFANLHSTPSWIEYFKLATWVNFGFFFLGLLGGYSNFEWFDFGKRASLTTATTAIILFIYEKVKKELFVLITTNARTKKQFMQAFSCSNPTMIVSKEGHVQLVNAPFEDYMRERFGQKAVPLNFLKFIQGDEDAKSKLEGALKNVHAASLDGETDSQHFRLMLHLDQIFAPPKPAKDQDDGSDSENKEPQQKWEEEIFPEKYELLFAIVTPIQFKQGKSLCVEFERMTHHKARFRLLSMHTRLTSQFIRMSQKRIESLHKEMGAVSPDFKVQIADFLGNQQLTLNMTEQLSYYLRIISNMKAQSRESYVLNGEIENVIESIAASKWGRELNIYIKMGNLPNSVLGDRNKFRVCLRTLLEFAILYGNDKHIELKCDFTGLTKDREYVIQFEICLGINNNHDISPLQDLYLKKSKDVLKEGKEERFDYLIRQHYDKFFQLIRSFGYGIILLPTLTKQLNGSSNIEHIFDLEKHRFEGETKNFKIGFSLPFESAGGQQVTAAANYSIGGTKQVINGREVFKTPNMQSRPLRTSSKKMTDILGGFIGSKHAAPSPQLSNLAPVSAKNHSSNSTVVGQALPPVPPRQVLMGGVAPQPETQNSNEQTLGSEACNANTISITLRNLQKPIVNKDLPMKHPGSVTPAINTSNQSEANQPSLPSVVQSSLKQEGNLQSVRTAKFIEESKQQDAFSFAAASVGRPPAQGGEYDNAPSFAENSNMDPREKKMSSASLLNNQISKVVSPQKMMSGALMRDRGSLGRDDRPARKSTIVAPRSKHYEDPIINDLAEGRDAIKIPESINMDGKIIDISDRLEDSEHLDRVASLNQKEFQIDFKDTTPFDLKLDQLDSVMSEKGDSSRRESSSKSSSIYPTRQKSKPLSKFVSQDQVDKFAMMAGASKNILKKQAPPMQKPMPDSEVASVGSMSIEPSQPVTQNQPHQTTNRSTDTRNIMRLAQELSQIAEQQNESHLDSKKGDCRSISSKDTVNLLDPKINKYTGRPEIIQTDAFLKSSQKPQLSIKYTTLKRFKEKQSKWTGTQMKGLAGKHKKVWEKNLLMHPPETNDCYDCQDKNQTLKDLKQTMQRIQDGSTAAVSKAPSVPASRQKQEQTAKPLEGKQRVLIVEDNEFIQQAVQTQLRFLNVDYVSCYNGQESVEKIEECFKEKKMFDIVLMDLIMPVMNGNQATCKIRELEKQYNISPENALFIVAYSSQVNAKVEQECFDNKMDDIVAKPMTKETMERMLKKHDRRLMLR